MGECIDVGECSCNLEFGIYLGYLEYVLLSFWKGYMKLGVKMDCSN